MKNLLLLISTLLMSTQATANDRFVELCTGDKYLAKNFGDGNIAGHALIYVNGLCKDMGKDFPQVKPCDSSDNHEGVGISLDAAFKNVKWMAVPTRELALFGDYGSDKVDDSVVQNIMKKAKEYNVFENIIFDESAFPKAIFEYTSDKIDQYTLYSIGTGIAFNTARNMNCVKVNIGEKQLDNLTKFLNGTNQKYFLNDDTYEWSISDNCTHLSVNTLASAGIGSGRKVKTKRNFIANLFSLTLPKSELLKMVRRVNKKTFSPRIVWENVKYRNFFNKFNRLPWGYGNLVSKYDIVKNNDFFHTTGGSLFALPTIGMSLNKIERKEYTDTTANLRAYKKSISKALESSHFKWKFKREPQRRAFLAKYKLYLEGLIAEINTRLESGI